MLDDYAAHIRNHAAWVVKFGGAVTGLLVLLPRDGHLLLDNVAIEPGASRVGPGQRLDALRRSRGVRGAGYGELRLYTRGR